MARIAVTLRKSTIGYSHRQRRIIQSLGLRKLNHTVEHDDSESIIGMIKKVGHLVDVVELDN
jgi:large subunit ribosomal protein L30